MHHRTTSCSLVLIIKSPCWGKMSLTYEIQQLNVFEYKSWDQQIFSRCKDRHIFSTCTQSKCELILHMSHVDKNCGGYSDLLAHKNGCWIFLLGKSSLADADQRHQQKKCACHKTDKWKWADTKNLVSFFFCRLHWNHRRDQTSNDPTQELILMLF